MTRIWSEMGRREACHIRCAYVTVASQKRTISLNLKKLKNTISVARLFHLKLIAYFIKWILNENASLSLGKVSEMTRI